MELNKSDLSSGSIPQTIVAPDRWLEGHTKSKLFVLCKTGFQSSSS